MLLKRNCIKYFFFFCLVIPFFSNAQVNAVTFGKNRIQYKKFKWKMYQSPHFNTYVSQGGTELGRNVALMAETELPSLEDFTKLHTSGRIEIVVYNSYDDFKQTNIGLGNDWISSGGLTKLVNNKLVVYFDGNHNHLKKDIRTGIAKVMISKSLFGDNIEDIATNQVSLDFPQWFVDGYIAYAAEKWSTEKDDLLKAVITGGDYTKFTSFAADKPLLAGNAFWEYLAEKYKPENVTYFFKYAVSNRSMNQAAKRICKKKIKEVLTDFMVYEEDKFDADSRRRHNAPKGTFVTSEEVNDKKDLFRFQVNPNPKNNSYAVVEFKQGVYSVKYTDVYYDETVLLKKGIRIKQEDVNPDYPIIAWDGKGTRLLVIYWEEGEIKMFVYDFVAGAKRSKQTITGVDQILDASFMLDANTLVLSAVKNGHTDIFTYKIEEQKLTQITDDVYDDLHPMMVSFPNRSGIIFSSNRPSANAPSNDTVLPSKNRFNIFLVDILNQSANKQITQLTDMKFGNADYPMQYNTNHFTFVSDESGIGNRWAGFFATKRSGLDSLFYVGDEILRNPSRKDLDSALLVWQKDKADSISTVQIYNDSTYTFPITNYENSLLETRASGNNGQVSEIQRDGDSKDLFKLKVNEVALLKRNVTARPTEYMKRLMNEKRDAEGKPVVYSNNTNQIKKPDTTAATPKQHQVDFFQNEFSNEKPDTTVIVKEVDDMKDVNESNPLYKKIKLYNYHRKFYIDNVLAGVDNTVLVNRYQPYAGGYGPIYPNNSALDYTFRMGATELMEDVKIIGAMGIGADLQSNNMMLSYQNYRNRVDWGFTYFRSNTSNYPGYFSGALIDSFYTRNLYSIDKSYFNAKLVTNLYQFNVSYPFDEIRSLRATLGLRVDRGTLLPTSDSLPIPSSVALSQVDSITKFYVARIEYVYDNSINPTINIWNGTRWKVYFDINTPANENTAAKGKSTFNFGFDFRHYVKIYRNFIWATRAAGDFSWGGQKILYYLGGADGDLIPKFNNNNAPAADQSYAYQALTVNLRGFTQNIANGNNAVVINSEFRLPVLTTLLNTPINNPILRNFQVIQFLDLGTAWNGNYNGIKRPSQVYVADPLTVTVDAGGIGPFAAGYGFGARTSIAGYFLKLDAGWPMIGFFRGNPVWYFALGLDF